MAVPRCRQPCRWNRRTVPLMPPCLLFAVVEGEDKRRAPCADCGPRYSNPGSSLRARPDTGRICLDSPNASKLCESCPLFLAGVGIDNNRIIAPGVHGIDIAFFGMSRHANCFVLRGMDTQVAHTILAPLFPALSACQARCLRRPRSTHLLAPRARNLHRELHLQSAL